MSNVLSSPYFLSLYKLFLLLSSLELRKVRMLRPASLLQCQEASPIPLRVVDQVFSGQCFSLPLACKALALGCELNVLCPQITPLPETLLGKG